MKLRTLSPELLAQVVATPENSPSADVGTIADAEIAKLHERNAVERRGFLFVGERDGSDIYINLTQESGSPTQYQYAV